MNKRKASVALEQNGNESNNNDVAQEDKSDALLSQSVIRCSDSLSHQGLPSVGEDRQQVTSNNQNDNSNSSSNINNSNSGSQHKSKKERADNWSSAEIQVLHRGIETRRDIFYGPPSQATKKSRELAWEAITKEVNSVSTTPRSLSQVMKKFKNEKCRAKRKFVDSDKDGHTDVEISNVSNYNNNNGNTSNENVTNNGDISTNLNSHGNSNNQQHQLSQSQQAHHMTVNDQMPASQPAINVVKLTPQNVAKTMIDLPGHVQQIQMPNDDMVLIVPPDGMDGLLSGMNIVSDALQNHSHSHHNQHTIQTLNTTQSLPNGPMTSSMMARSIPAGSMCSLVYSTGGDVCAGPEQHLATNVVSQNALSNANHIGVHAQNLMHHRVSIEQNQGQHQHPHQQQQQQPPAPQQHHHHQMHQQQSLSQQQQSNQHQHQHQQQQHHHQQHPQHQPQQLSAHQQPLAQHPSTTSTMANTGGIAVESQLKNLLFNLLFKDGVQHLSAPIANQNHTLNKQRNDALTNIANSLSKIESHLDKLTKVISPLIARNDSSEPGIVVSSAQLSGANNNINTSDRNNNNVNVSAAGNNMSNQRNAEE